MLALSFLLLIGFDRHVPKGYIYFAMAFSVLVKLLNLRVRRRRESQRPPVKLHRPYARESEHEREPYSPVDAPPVTPC